ncbi:MAG: glycosyltransferase family 39 protein [Candidatus Parcubacteria bacterium]|nr:glycosyltransferase family 39 protein [Candidatus Parcubacteria bacterium]
MKTILKKYFWICFALFVLLLSLLNFQTNPRFGSDEGIVSQLTKNMALYNEYAVQTAPQKFFIENFWITVGYPVTLPQYLLFEILGIKIWTARLVPLFYMIGLVIVSNIFIRKLYGFRASILSGLLLISFPPFYGNGKSVLGETPGLFWLFLGGLLYLLYEERKSVYILFLSSLAFGLGISTKPYFLLFYPALMVFVYLMFYKHREKQRYILIFLSGTILPVLIWIISVFGFNSLSKLSSIFFFYLNSYNAAINSFIPLISKNLFKFVSEFTPLHFSLLAVGILSSIFVNKRFVKDRSFHPLLVAYFVFGLLSFFWYLKTPGWYRYFYSVHIMLILFFPPLFLLLANNLYVKFKINFKKTAVIFIFLLLLAQTIYLTLNYNRFYSDELFRLKDFINKNISLDDSIFVISKPEVAFLLDRENFYQTIFINNNLIIGENILLKEHTDYIIMDRDDVFYKNKINSILEKNYDLFNVIGHYYIYKVKS